MEIRRLILPWTKENSSCLNVKLGLWSFPAFDLEWKHQLVLSQFSGSPACWLLIWQLQSQFLVINPLLPLSLPLYILLVLFLWRSLTNLISIELSQYLSSYLWRLPLTFPGLRATCHSHSVFIDCPKHDKKLQLCFFKGNTIKAAVWTNVSDKQMLSLPKSVQRAVWTWAG